MTGARLPGTGSFNPKITWCPLPMSAPLKYLTVNALTKHTATVIFVHVRPNIYTEFDLKFHLLLVGTRRFRFWLATSSSDVQQGPWVESCKMDLTSRVGLHLCVQNLNTYFSFPFL